MYSLIYPPLSLIFLKGLVTKELLRFPILKLKSFRSCEFLWIDDALSKAVRLAQKLTTFSQKGLERRPSAPWQRYRLWWMRCWVGVGADSDIVEEVDRLERVLGNAIEMLWSFLLMTASIQPPLLFNDRNNTCCFFIFITNCRLQFLTSFSKPVFPFLSQK